MKRHSRRAVLASAGAARRRPARSGVPLLTVRPAMATPEKMQAAIKAVVGEAPVTKGRVTLDIPPLVENGNTVAMTVTVESPMTPADHVKVVHVFNEKNPQPNVIDAYFGPRAAKGVVLLAHPPRRHPDPRRDRRDERRLVLVRPGRRHRHARRLPGVQLMARTLINVPPKAKRGQVIEVKTLISHIMETAIAATRSARSCRATSSMRSYAPITARKYSAPGFIRRLRRTRSSASS